MTQMAAGRAEGGEWNEEGMQRADSRLLAFLLRVARAVNVDSCPRILLSPTGLSTM
jgi:ABC-type transporter Mla MlaB component